MSYLESQKAIETIVLQYAKFIREGAGGRCGPLFTDDALYEIYDLDSTDGEPVLRSRNVGRDAIIAHIGKNRPGMRVCPLLSNLLIEVDGSVAKGSAVMRAHVLPSGTVTMGEYSDSFQHDATDGWRFSKRIYTIWSS